MKKTLISGTILSLGIIFNGCVSNIDALTNFGTKNKYVTTHSLNFNNDWDYVKEKITQSTISENEFNKLNKIYKNALYNKYSTKEESHKIINTLNSFSPFMIRMKAINEFRKDKRKLSMIDYHISIREKYSRFCSKFYNKFEELNMPHTLSIVKNICKGYFKDIKFKGKANQFNLLVKNKIPNYCITRQHYYDLTVLDGFGERTKINLPMSLAVYRARMNNVSNIFEAKKEEGIIFAEFLKFTKLSLEKKYAIDVFARSGAVYAETITNSGIIPLIDIEIENLQGKKFKIRKNLSAGIIGDKIGKYYSDSLSINDFIKRALLINAFIYIYTNHDVPRTVFKIENYKKVSFINSTSIVSVTIDSLLRIPRKYQNVSKISSLIYKLYQRDPNVIKWMLQDKEVKRLFNFMLDVYNKSSTNCKYKRSF